MEGLEGTILGDFHLLEVIGQGGMTTVYKAADRTGNRTVAVKVLSPYIAQDPNFKNRFEREIEVLLRVKHPRIVPILDYGEAQSFAYIVMPYFPAGTLHDRLDKGPLDPAEGARIIDDISQALQFAHDEGVVHRDVKPSNVLLDENGDAFLSDFGFAQFGDVSLNLTGSALIGTPAYMSPEQCQGKSIDARSDQYSLAVLLYQISTGYLPFEGKTAMAIAVKHINEPIPRPRRLNPYLPERVEAVLLKALSKDPEKRYSDISELNRAFQTAMQASLDESGNFIPDPRRFEVATWVMERSPLAGPLSGIRQLWSNQRGLALVLLFMMLALPTAGFAISAITPDTGTGPPRNEGSFDAQATIDALSTRIALEMGSGADAGSIAAAVAATLNASLPEGSRIASLATPTFDILSGLESPPAATETQAAGATLPGSTSTGDGTIPGPSATPLPEFSATPTRTATPAYSPTTGPTATPGPTHDPGPSDCAKLPTQVPNYCEPSATPSGQ